LHYRLLIRTHRSFAGIGAPADAVVLLHRASSPPTLPPHLWTPEDLRWAPSPPLPLPRPASLPELPEFWSAPPPAAPRATLLGFESFQGSDCKPRAFLWRCISFQGPVYKCESSIVFGFGWSL
jgi:hypothetical protein